MDRFFTDEELVAYMDGESEFAPVDEITLSLASDPALKQRLEALALDKTKITDAFSRLKPPPGKSPELPMPGQSGFALYKVAAIALLAVFLGGFLGFGLSSIQRHGPNDWKQYVAAYQALYINATLASVDIPQSAKEMELSRITSSIGKSVDIATLQSNQEVDYKRAQILGFEGRPLVQLAFLSRTGAPVALCIFRNGNADANIQQRNLEGMQSATWSRDGYEYLLIGGTDEPLIARMANHFVTLGL
ncbi:MAG: hypothetical protein ABJP82_05220 [Hyphomicrobiales bacterium]